MIAARTRDKAIMPLHYHMLSPGAASSLRPRLPLSFAPQIPYSVPSTAPGHPCPKGGGMSRRYETVYIFDSVLDEPAITEKLNRFHALLTKDGKGTMTNVSHWGKRTLTYKIKKKDTGYYVVAEFQAAGDLLPEYERAVKLDEGVLRYMCVEASREQ